MLIQKTQIKDLFFLILYKAFLDFSYINFQSVLFAYNGYKCDFDILYYLLGWAVYICGILVISSSKETIGELFVITIYLLSITPFIVIFQFDKSCKFWMVLIQIICLWVMDFLINKAVPFHTAEIKGVHYKSSGFRQLAVSVLIVYLLYVVVRFGIPSLSSLAFEEVYDTRGSVNLSTVDSLVMNVICKIACPLFILFSFKEKKWGWLGFGLFIQVYSYAVTGYKTYLFIPVILIAVNFFEKLNIKRTVIIGLSALVGFANIIYMITRNSMFYAIIMNRVFFLPARIKYCYFDYFSTHDYVYFSQNSIAKILGIKSNYSTNVMYLIGGEYFHKSTMWTNTGFMADAYSNGGILGIIIIAVILSIVIIFLKKQLELVPINLQKPLQTIFLMYFISLNDGAAISVLFSGGLIIAILLVCIIKFHDDTDYYGYNS